MIAYDVFEQSRDETVGDLYRSFALLFPCLLD